MRTASGTAVEGAAGYLRAALVARRRRPAAGLVAHGDLRSDQSGACLGGDGSGIAIKSSFGKLDAPADLLDALRTSNLDTLPLQAGHAAALRDLPWHHRDPFDRLLIAQATVEDLAVASLDRSLAAYDIRPLPA